VFACVGWQATAVIPCQVTPRRSAMGFPIKNIITLTFFNLLTDNNLAYSSMLYKNVYSYLETSVTLNCVNLSSLSSYSCKAQCMIGSILNEQYRPDPVNNVDVESSMSSVVDVVVGDEVVVVVGTVVHKQQLLY